MRITYSFLVQDHYFIPRIVTKVPKLGPKTPKTTKNVPFFFETCWARDRVSFAYFCTLLCLDFTWDMSQVGFMLYRVYCSELECTAITIIGIK